MLKQMVFGVAAAIALGSAANVAQGAIAPTGSPVIAKASTGPQYAFHFSSRRRCNLVRAAYFEEIWIGGQLQGAIFHQDLYDCARR